MPALESLRSPDFVRSALLEVESAQAPVRRTLGLPERDELAIDRIAERYRPPAWAQGCISAHDALFLYDLIRASRPERIIEIGVASGGSTAVLLLALADAGVRLIAPDGRPALRSFDLHPFCYFDRSRPVGSAVPEMLPELAHGVEFHTHATAAHAAALFRENPVAFALIDADHRHPWPVADLLALLPALRPGAWVALHDIALPEIAAARERRTGQPATPCERGAQLLFDSWPFEKIRGGGTPDRFGGRNIGAIRLPRDRTVCLDDFRELIEIPWETQPPETVQRLLRPTKHPRSLSTAHVRRTPRPPTVVALIAPHGVSGVSASMARLAHLRPPHIPWRLLAIGTDSPPHTDILGGDTPGFQSLTWPAAAGVVDQVRLVRDKLRELQADVVSPNFLMHGFIAAALDRYRGRRVAAIWHGSELVADDLYERAVPLADSWRAVSEGIRGRAFRFSNALQPPPILPAGIDLPPATTPPPCTRSPREPLRLLYAAWLDERAKRVMDLPLLADALHARGVDFRLTIAGKGPAAAKLAAALAAHIVAGRVSMAGPVSHACMPTLHRGHDITLLVSAMEGTPVVVMEAMAHARAVAITRGCGGALSAVRDGENGIIVPVGDMASLAARLAELAHHPARIADMGRQARTAAESRFDTRGLAADYDLLINEARHAPDAPTPSDPAAIAELWGRILAALEFMGLCPSTDLCSLACEWLTDLGTPPVYLHLTDDAETLIESVTRHGPDLIRGVVYTSPGASKKWGGWSTLEPTSLPADALILTTQPASARGLLPRNAHILPLCLPCLPTLAARLLTATVADLRARGHARLALYGAGKHTRKLARWVVQMPEITAIIDDRAGEPSGPGHAFLGLPIIKPEAIDAAAIDAIIISSDEYERTMLPQALRWAGERPVVPLYERLEASAGSCSNP